MYFEKLYRVKNFYSRYSWIRIFQYFKTFFVTKETSWQFTEIKTGFSVLNRIKNLEIQKRTFENIFQQDFYIIVIKPWPMLFLNRGFII